MNIRLSQLALVALPLVFCSTGFTANSICSTYQKQIQGTAVGCDSAATAKLAPATVTNYTCGADSFTANVTTATGDTYSVTANAFGSGSLKQVNYSGEMAGGISFDAGPGYVGGVFQFAADGTPTLGVGPSTHDTYCQVMEFVTYGAQECCK